ncbi:hypothetical protein [uncultured Endozoicomonas sp.]|uniref:hypothetical protein n=1 Tax=uncultured Endozoicomonas sp. TaxID=432652 RepID=UPI002627C372|nr:hypothetical protein [uncultured Endozoicomonas sp.]
MLPELLNAIESFSHAWNTHNKDCLLKRLYLSGKAFVKGWRNQYFVKIIDAKKYLEDLGKRDTYSYQKIKKLYDRKIHFLKSENKINRKNSKIECQVLQKNNDSKDKDVFETNRCRKGGSEISPSALSNILSLAKVKVLDGLKQHFSEYYFQLNHRDEGLPYVEKMVAKGINAVGYELTGRGVHYLNYYIAEAVLNTNDCFLMYKSTGTSTGSE